MDVKSTWIPTWHRMDHVSWSLELFKNHLLEVCLTQNQAPMALQTLVTVDFILLNHVWRPAWIEIQWNSIWLRAWSHMTSHYAWGFVTTLHEFGGVSVGMAFGHFLFGVSQLNGHGSWLVYVWSGPYMVYETGCNWEGQQTDFLWPRSKAASEILWCVTPKFLHAIIGIMFAHIWFEGMIWGMFVAAKSWEIYY